MRVRRVHVSLELDTDMPLRLLKDPKWWRVPLLGRAIAVMQVQVNVMREQKPYSGERRTKKKDT